MSRRELVSLLVRVALIISFVVLSPHPVNIQALTRCYPTWCSCSCGSCCTYYSCSRRRTVTFTVRCLPFTYTAPPGACSDNLNGTVIRCIPFYVDGRRYSCLPARVTHTYYTCRSHSKCCPPCPPPPPPPSSSGSSSKGGGKK